MSPRFAFLTTLFAAVLPSGALDITGIVINKIDQPIPLAQICLRSAPSRCVSTSVNGTFRITDAGVGIASAGENAAFNLELQGARMILTVPRGERARVAWHDASGRSLAPERSLDLASGRNLIGLPELPRDGLHFVRITLPGRTLVWKALLLGGQASLTRAAAGAGAGSLPVAALSKAAAALTDLIVTKTGFQTATYRPGQEVEVGAVVVLAAKSDSGFVFTSTFTATNAIDRAKGQWITEDTVPACNGPIAVKTVVRDTSRFAVRDGKLFQYYAGDCIGEMLTGANSDVVGAWNLSESEVFLPSDLRPAACKDTILSTPVPETVKGVVTISETQQIFEISAEICPPDLYLDLIAFYILSDTTVELTRNTCRSLAFKNGAAEEATLDFSKRGDSLASVFTFKTSVCSATEMMRQGDDVAIDCVSNDPLFVFLDCLAGTGYFGDLPPAPLAKAGPRGMIRLPTSPPASAFLPRPAKASPPSASIPGRAGMKPGPVRPGWPLAGLPMSREKQ